MAQTSNGKTSQTNGGPQSPSGSGPKVKKQGVDSVGRKYTRWVNANSDQGPEKRRSGQAPASARTKKPNEVLRDVKNKARSPKKNSRGNVKRSEIKAQRQKSAALKALDTPQASKQPSKAIEEVVTQSLTDSKNVIVDGRTIAYTSSSGADRELNFSKNADGEIEFTTSEDTAVDLAEGLTSEDQSVREQTEQEVYDLANLLEQAGDKISNLLDIKKEKEPLSDEAKEAYNEVNNTSDEEKAKSEEIESIKAKLSEQGVDVKSISSTGITVNTENGSMRFQAKDENGKLSLKMDKLKKKLKKKKLKLKKKLRKKMPKRRQGKML